MELRFDRTHRLLPHRVLLLQLRDRTPLNKKRTNQIRFTAVFMNPLAGTPPNAPIKDIHRLLGPCLERCVALYSPSQLPSPPSIWFNSLFKLGVDISACLLDSLNQGLPLHKLLAHVIHRPLQHEALRATLSLQTGHELGEPIEALPNGLAALLL